MTRQDANTGSPQDAFTTFWSDFMSRMSAAGMNQAFNKTSAPTQEESTRQMRQAFFDAWAKSCDEVMHSEAFLSTMKSSMDAALTFRQQLNEFLEKSLQDSPMPARSDIESVLLAVRTMEDRVLEKIEDLNRRVDKLEERKPPARTVQTATANRSKRSTKS